ncbi:MAG: bifunctional metallophosphatase/5'-nucleotidase [Methanomicrobiales archaeon]|nr:bifunctional metallophosphatase/5'-nucleotidase [Methanomicrobiales archaeon]
MTPGSRWDSIPIGLQILLGFVVLCVLILTPVLLSWSLPGNVPASPAKTTVHVKILAINDFHGQLPPGQTLNKRPVGGAPVLASYIKSAMAPGNIDDTIIALPGDLVGASPPESGLLLDEPTMLYFNTWANQYCNIGPHPSNASCNIVATLGNHEFDKGVTELMRKIIGGDGSTNITHLVDPYPGTRIDYVCANVVWKANNTPILPPYTLRNLSGVSVAFIGVDTMNTPELEEAINVEGVTFLDEADSINRYTAEIQRQGVHAIVVLLHEGGSQTPYDGPTQANGTVTGRVAGIIPQLDSDVDVVLSGYTHAFTNAYLDNAGKKPVLVTQAYMYSKGFADIDLVIDKTSGDIVEKSARIVPAYADQPPGSSPDPAATAFLAADQKVVGPMKNQFIGVAALDITRTQNSAGEDALGDMVADGQRAAMKTEVGFDTSGNIRADLSVGNITWGDLYAVQPFANTVQSMTLTGEQIHRVLEQQWQEPLPLQNLVVSGFVYTWDAAKPAGSKVTSVTVQGVPLDPKEVYTVSIINYLSSGGDGYTTFIEGKNITNGPVDIDALVTYVGSLPQPVNVTVDGRIQRTN